MVKFNTTNDYVGGDEDRKANFNVNLMPLLLSVPGLLVFLFLLGLILWKILRRHLDIN